VDVDEVFEGLARRRSHRERVRRVQAGLLAFAVLATTIGGFSILTRLFDPDRRVPLAITPFGAAGAIVVCGDPNGEHLCRIDSQALARGATAEDLVRLTDVEDEIVSMPAVSFDGTTVVFDRHDPHSGTSGLWTMGTDGSDERLLVDGGLTNASWSPTGLLVAVAAAGTPSGEPAALAILDPTRAPTPVVRTIVLPGLSFPSTPRFSPDGKQILFVAGEDPNSTGSHVYTVSTDGGRVRNRGGTGAMTPDWSPDGQQIVFSVGTVNGVELFVCPLDCSSRRPLQDPSGAGLDGGLPRWSPDGHWISYQTEEGGNPVLNVVLVDGTAEQRLASGVGDLAWIPAVDADAPAPSPGTEPSVSAGPSAEGTDIGLGFKLCDLHRIGGIDWFGDGRKGAAWTGRRLSDEGGCPMSDDTSNTDDSTLVIADLDADGLADTWSPLDLCISCEPWAKIDLDANGAEELVVLIQGGTTPQYGFYFAVPEGLPRASGIYSVGIQRPGAPAAGFPIESPVTIWAGGDAGDSFAIRCEGSPADPILVAASLHAPVDTDIREIHVTRLKLVTTRDLVDAHFVVLDSTSPKDANEPWGGDAKACGVDFNPWA
jgi:hypothetical protein